MLKIGVIGLGNIAQKAYLPVFGESQDRAEWFLSSRSANKLEHLQKKYNFPHATQDMEDLLKVGLDAVFIHTPTSTHTTFIKRFLQAGINVYVDKPISENFEEVQELFKLAQQKGLLLTTGFNRRFSPLNIELKNQANKKVITVEKTRVSAEQPVIDAIYDLFIHVIDTALWLGDITSFAQSNITFDVKADKHGNLHYCQLTISTADKVVISRMNMNSGSDQEVATVETDDGIYSVTNLEMLTIQNKNGVTSKSLPGWTPMLTRRGFEPLISEYLTQVTTRELINPVSSESSLLSHKACQLLADFWLTKQ